VKLSHLNHLLDLVAKFEQEKVHELGVKRIRKKKRPQKEVTQPKIAKVLMTVSTPLKWGRLFSENDKNVNGSHKPS
jgi:methanogenic corrinoid protein MtbC1